MKIRNKISGSVVDGAVRVGCKWEKRDALGNLIELFTSDSWEEVLEEKSNLVWIRSKTTGAMIRAKTFLAGRNSTPQWFTVNIEKGTETFYSSDVWEEVMPAERWVNVGVYLRGDGESIYFRHGDSYSPVVTTSYKAPDGHRFILQTDGSIKIQRKV